MDPASALVEGNKGVATWRSVIRQVDRIDRYTVLALTDSENVGFVQSPCPPISLLD